MNYLNNKDLSFDVISINGKKITCDVLSVIPNDENKNEPYVVFTDYLLDENDNFILRFGKIVEENGEYRLSGVHDRDTIRKIREQLEDETVSSVNKQFQDSLDD